MGEQHGLSSGDVLRIRESSGWNEITAKRASIWTKIGKALIAPVSLMIIAASLLSFFIGRTFDGSFILSLLVLNLFMSLWHERKADRALEELSAKLAVSARVLRDGAWTLVPSRELVPGDYIECDVGALIPADALIVEANNLQINEAVLTGESLPKEKKSGDTAYSGSVVTTGLLRGPVSAIGNKAFFGKIATSAQGAKRRSTTERDILAISRFLIVASLIAIAILTVVFIVERQPIADTLLLDVSLLIAGIPISLPTVMTLILSIGALALASKDALTRRLAALEDFANVTLLLTDKTGTLTENKISVERTLTYAPYSEHELLKIAGAASNAFQNDAIDSAIARAGKQALADSKLTILESTPGDSSRKRTTTLIELDGERLLVSIGTPPLIAGLCSQASESFEEDVRTIATTGARALAIAIKARPNDIQDEHDMRLAGLFALADPLRNDANDTIAFLRSEGVHTIMVTGDTKETAEHVARALDMQGSVVRARDVDFKALPKGDLARIAAFAEVLPEDKLALVERAEQTFTVAMAGDGVNDLPAVRRADVGMAVANAVDALKGTADIVFLSPGITVMQTGLVEARKIFFRLYNYSLYRISESFRLVISALVLGLLIKGFPLTPVQIIILAFLNDIPIITLAFDRVKRLDRPADISMKERLTFGVLFGSVGVAESVCFYGMLAYVFHLPLESIQTAFFLKLTVSGHMLIYVAHTKERWWRFLPAPSVIVATFATQILATTLTLIGILVAPISITLVLFTWGWALLWMQLAEAMKPLGELLLSSTDVGKKDVDVQIQAV